MIMPSPASQAAASASDQSQVMITADGVSLLEIPSNRQQDNRNVEIIEVRSQGDPQEDDLGLPAPDIELLDDQLPSSQMPATAKRGREASPKPHLEDYRPSPKSLHLMTIDERIEFESRPLQQGEFLGERQRIRDQDIARGRAPERPATTQPGRASASRQTSPSVPRTVVAASTPIRTAASSATLSMPARDRTDRVYPGTSIRVSSARQPAGTPPVGTTSHRQDRRVATATSEPHSPRCQLEINPREQQRRQLSPRVPVTRRHSASPRGRHSFSATREADNRGESRNVRHSRADRR